MSVEEVTYDMLNKHLLTRHTSYLQSVLKMVEISIFQTYIRTKLIDKNLYAARERFVYIFIVLFAFISVSLYLLFPLFYSRVDLLLPLKSPFSSNIIDLTRKTNTGDRLRGWFLRDGAGYLPTLTTIQGERG